MTKDGVMLELCDRLQGELSSDGKGDDQLSDGVMGELTNEEMKGEPLDGVGMSMICEAEVQWIVVERTQLATGMVNQYTWRLHLCHQPQMFLVGLARQSVCSGEFYFYI